MTLTKLIACINTFTVVAVIVLLMVAMVVMAAGVLLASSPQQPFPFVCFPILLILNNQSHTIEHYSYYQPKTIPYMPQMASIAAIIPIVSTKIIRIHTARTHTLAHTHRISQIDLNKWAKAKEEEKIK